MRRKEMKKIVSLGLLVVLLALGVAACKPTPAEKPTKAAQPTKPPAAEEISLRLWAHQNEAFNSGYQALIDAYMEKNPNVKITLETFEYDLYIQTLQTAMPAGEEADILQLFGTWTSEYAERLLSVPEDVMSVSEAKETFYPSTLGGFIVDGALYGLPQETNLEYGGVLVNKTLYESAGLTYPPAWESMDDVLEDAKALATVEGDVMTVSGFHFASSDGAFFSFMAGIKQRGGDYWNADQTGFTFDTPEAEAQLQWMVDAIQVHGVSDPVLFEDAEGWVGDEFFQGRVGIGYIGTWMIAEGRVGYPDFKDEWDYLWLPPVAGGEHKFIADSGWGLTVSPNSEHPNVAWDFAKFAAANADNARSWNIASGTIPAMPAVAKSAEIASEMPWVAKSLDVLPYGEYMGDMPDRDLIVYEIVFPHILYALQGLETVDEALQAMDNEANAAFE
jgi:multiple sugar transport system substrate-binding protein